MELFNLGIFPVSQDELEPIPERGFDRADVVVVQGRVEGIVELGESLLLLRGPFERAGVNEVDVIVDVNVAIEVVV